MTLSIFEFVLLTTFAVIGGLAVLYLLIRSVVALVIKDSGEIKALKLEEKLRFDKMVEQLDAIMSSDRDMSEDPVSDDDDISDDEIDDSYLFEEDEDEEEDDDDEDDDDEDDEDDEDEDDEDDDDFDDDDDLEDDDEESEDEEPEYGEDELAPIDEILKKYKKFHMPLKRSVVPLQSLRDTGWYSLTFKLIKCLYGHFISPTDDFRV